MTRKLVSILVLGYLVSGFSICGHPVPPIDPCLGISCPDGSHCEGGKCVQNPPPEDPCQGITCDPGYKCVQGTCVGSCDGFTCSTGFHCEMSNNKPTCVRDPIVDPCAGVVCDPGSHCEKGNCVPDTPPPPTNPCPKTLAEGAIVYMNDKAYGQGWDSTVRVKGDPEFCRIIYGQTLNDCHLEGWPKRAECEYYLLNNNCPIWQYSPDKNNAVICHDDRSAEASCDHFGNPVFRDDPATRTTGDNLENLKGFEGEPKVCGLHRDEFGPYEGFFMVAHGIGFVRACTDKLDPKTCGPWQKFDH